MAECLINDSTDPSCDSDAEDCNKCKIVEISMNRFSYACKILMVHIDNSRDIRNTIVKVIFYAAQSCGGAYLTKYVYIEPKACTWISVKIHDDRYTDFRLEFHGRNNKVKVRQIKFFALPNTVDEHLPQQNGNWHANHRQSSLKQNNGNRGQKQFYKADTLTVETLCVFRWITGQVFGKLISITGQESGSKLVDRQHYGLDMDSNITNSLLDDSLDLREHMVGILFSRSKLCHLQEQVIVHVVQAIKKEAQRAKEDWEKVNLSNGYKTRYTKTSNGLATFEPKRESNLERYRSPDTYCFEMLSMLFALSSSAVALLYLSQQRRLLRDLLSLLHTGSDRVQRQVTALLRRILPEISPENFADILGVQRLPPADYNIAHQIRNDFDMNRLGLFDIFLAVIAKSMEIQIKMKTTNINENIEKVPSFVRLCNSIDLSCHLLGYKIAPPKDSTACGNDTNGASHFPKFLPPIFNRNARIAAQSSNNRKAVCLPMNRSMAKSSNSAPSNINQRWFLNGMISMKQAECIIALIRDLASGKLGEKWSQITKAVIAEAVLNLTRLNGVFRKPENCVKTATLWLALASLCVLDVDHVEKLSTRATGLKCSNHDDGETAATIQCVACGSLCEECDQFLHLNRNNRTHKRTVCKEEVDAVRVELNDSYGRTKLFWLLALADSKTLKGMVEFREIVERCRFCGTTSNITTIETSNVCTDAQCQEYAANSCFKNKPCGHVCAGVANERKCLPCLHNCCQMRENELAEQLHAPKLTQDADNMCMICFVDPLSCAPSIHLDCGHVFHYHCCKTVLEKRWNGPRIAFGFSLCPICKADIQHVLLADILEPINLLKEDVKRKALMRLNYEGVVKGNVDQDLTQLAMERYAYYVCFKCQKAYYGGEARCDAEIGDNFDPKELVCGGCSDVGRAQICHKHGSDYIEYKCRYCCSIAIYFCFGTTRFCNACHSSNQLLAMMPKHLLPKCPAGPNGLQMVGVECPLHVVHPPTGEEFALGCGVCYNEQTF